MGRYEQSNPTKKDAETIEEAIKHPERFCNVCWKRLGVCKHTRGFIK